MEFKSGYDITGQYNREESIQIWNANILTLKVFMFPSELRELISALICDVSAPQDLWSPFPQTTPPTVSFSSCSPDFITSRPRTAQQMQTSNIQHQLHLSSCLFSLLIETSGFSGNKRNVSSSPFIFSLEYISHLLSYFSLMRLHCNRVFSKLHDTH